MDIKPRPGHREYIQALRRMTSAERLKMAMEMSRMTKLLFKQQLRKQFPDLSDDELHRLFLERIDECRLRD